MWALGTWLCFDKLNPLQKIFKTQASVLDPHHPTCQQEEALSSQGPGQTVFLLKTGRAHVKAEIPSPPCCLGERTAWAVPSCLGCPLMFGKQEMNLR